MSPAITAETFWWRMIAMVVLVAVFVLSVIAFATTESTALKICSGLNAAFSIIGMARLALATSDNLAIRTASLRWPSFATALLAISYSLTTTDSGQATWTFVAGGSGALLLLASGAMADGSLAQDN